MGSLKALTRERALRVGHFVVEFATPGIGHMLKNAGCDYVLFDMEHSGFSYETIKSAVRWFEAAGLPAIVRVPAGDYHLIARAMDMGVEGLMVPMIGSADHAKSVLSSMKYTPQGNRGVALGVAHDNYTSGAVMEKLAAANERSTFFALIETAEGVENVEAIAAVDGVDCLWVGHFDLSASLGIPGEFAHPRFTAAIERIIAAARRHGKVAGRLVGSAAEGVTMHAGGFDVICYSGDVWVYQAAVKAGIEAIREGCARAPAGA